jgi:hypothetical protein
MWRMFILALVAMLAAGADARLGDILELLCDSLKNVFEDPIVSPAPAAHLHCVRRHVQ